MPRVAQQGPLGGRSGVAFLARRKSAVRRAVPRNSTVCEAVRRRFASQSRCGVRRVCPLDTFRSGVEEIGQSPCSTVSAALHALRIARAVCHDKVVAHDK
jgi:hypothetical protein